MFIFEIKIQNKIHMIDIEYNLLGSLRFEHPDELLPEACGTPDFPVLLPTAAADPADVAVVPCTPGGSANELVLGRPLPLISLCRDQGCFSLFSANRLLIDNTQQWITVERTPRNNTPLPPAVWADSCC